MRYSPFCERISGEGVAAWDIHHKAIQDKRAGRDVIVLSIGDPDFDTPPAITETAIASLRRGDTHYSDIIGYPDLRAAVAAQHKRRSGQEVTAANVAIVAGCQPGLFAASLCLLAPGDDVVVLDPMYLTYEATIQAAGARLIRVSQRPENHFHLDPKDLEKAITAKTKALFFATPSNPTGAMMSLETAQAVAEIAIRHDLWVVSDEVYAALTFGKQHVSIGGLPGMGERTVTVNSLSKSHAMTGWRIGWMVGPEELAHHVHALGLSMQYGLPPFIQHAATYALTHDVPEVEEMRLAYQRRRDAAVARLNQVPGLSCHVPEAGMFMMLDVRKTGMSAYDYAWGLYKATGVSVLDASAFGPSAAGHLRVSFVVDEASLDEACKRIASYTNSLPGVAA
ncbi:MAG TPA: aminotransferase class I/II-fold pyridoxal phosphate-dependent enzyme [Terriglobia bacterium]|nr:aminotransferase class I/II-fold pyridoxal phosphate-dependent enzyme [Terriglobia bacterium]